MLLCRSLAALAKQAELVVMLLSLQALELLVAAFNFVAVTAVRLLAVRWCFRVVQALQVRAAVWLWARATAVPAA